MPSLADYNALKATQAAEIARIQALVATQTQKIHDLEAAAAANEIPAAIIDAEQADLTALTAIT